MTRLDDLLRSRVFEWRKLSQRFRVAQEACEERTDEWYLNKENADMLDRCIGEVENDLDRMLELEKRQTVLDL